MFNHFNKGQRCHDSWFCLVFFVSCHVWIFHALCLKVFPVVCPLSLSVCQPCSLLVFSSVLLPLVTTPGLLPTLSPHLFLVGSSVSVYLVCLFPFTPRLVIVCLLNVPVCVASDPVPDSVLVMPLIEVSCLASFHVSWYVLVFEFCILLTWTLPFFLCTLSNWFILLLCFWLLTLFFVVLGFVCIQL